MTDDADTKPLDIHLRLDWILLAAIPLATVITAALVCAVYIPSP